MTQLDGHTRTQPNRLTRLAAVITAAAALLAASLSLPVPASAEPASAAAEPAPQGVTLDSRQLGMSPTIGFNAANAPQTVGIPVPEGTRPTTLTGQLQSIANIPSGYLDVTGDDGSLLSSIPIPDVSTAQVTVPFTVDLSMVNVRDNHAQISVVLRQTAGDAICGIPPSVTLSRLAVQFSGELGVPNSLEQFFPGVIGAVDIYVDPAPDPAESQAVLNLVSLLANRYQALPVRFAIRPLPRLQAPPVLTWDPMRRDIVVRSTGDARVALTTAGRTPYLEITGGADELVDQTALFRSELLALAETDTMTVDAVDELQVRGGGTTTFGQLGIGGQLTVLGEGSMYLTPDTAAFGLANPGAVENHLIAHYTPVKDTEKATLVIQSTGRVLYSAELGESGLLDARFVLPGDLAGSMAGLEYRVAYEPAPGACNPRTVPLRFEIDPSSTLTVVGGPVQMGGFSALPVGFAPTFQVALQAPTTQFLSRAATVVAAVGRLTSEELRPHLVPLDQAVRSGSGALIVADSAALNASPLDPPLNAEEQNRVTASLAGRSKVTLDVPDGLGSLQAFAQGNRTVVLVTTTGDWALADRTLAYLDSQPKGWRDLSGDVVVTGPNGESKDLAIRAQGPALQLVDAGANWVPWVVIGSVAAVAIAIGLLTVTVVRRRRHSGPPTAPITQ